MRAFRLIEMDGALLVEIADSELAACVRALDYTWGHKDSSQSVVAELNQVLNKHAATAAEPPAQTAVAMADADDKPKANRKGLHEAFPASVH